MIALQKEGPYKPKFSLNIIPCDEPGCPEAPPSNSEHASSRSSSFAEYLDLSEMITEESPIGLPRNKNGAVLLKIRRSQCK